MGQIYAKQVVNWFRAFNHSQMRGDEMVEPLTQMKAMKLLYYAQGIMLAAYDKPLFEEDILNWKYGPVVPEIHSIYHGKRAIVDVGDDNNKELDKNTLEDYKKLSEDTEINVVLTTVMDVYGDKSAIELMNMTHEEDPWKNTVRNETISNASIKEYFEENVLA